MARRYATPMGTISGSWENRPKNQAGKANSATPPTPITRAANQADVYMISRQREKARAPKL